MGDVPDCNSGCPPTGGVWAGCKGTWRSPGAMETVGLGTPCPCGWCMLPSSSETALEVEPPPTESEGVGGTKDPPFTGVCCCQPPFIHGAAALPPPMPMLLPGVPPGLLGVPAGAGGRAGEGEAAVPPFEAPSYDDAMGELVGGAVFGVLLEGQSAPTLGPLGAGTKSDASACVTLASFLASGIGLDTASGGNGNVVASWDTCGEANEAFTPLAERATLRGVPVLSDMLLRWDV